MPNMFGKGVKLKGNRVLINGGYRDAILFENWNFVKTEGAFLASGVKSDHGRIGWLDLGPDAIFVGVRDYDSDDIGRVNVVDSFSVLPVSFFNTIGCLMIDCVVSDHLFCPSNKAQFR
jgi:hypothetical protein